MTFLRPHYVCFLALLTLLITPLSYAESFTVEAANIHLKNDVYYLDAQFTFPLSASALNAIDNGVALYIDIAVNIYDNNNWWLDDNITQINQVYKVEYFELAKLYQITNLNTQEQNNFLFLSTAIDSIAQLTALPLIDKVLLDEKESYYAKVQTDLLISKLPLPLIPLAMVASEWEHESLKHLLVLK